MAREEPLLSLDPGANCWRIERAARASTIVDAEDYFRVARAAMLRARRRIMLIGWDFDARIDLVHGERLPGEPKSVGEFIYWLVERTPELEVYLLRWDVGALKTLLRGSTVFTVMKWMRHPRIHTKLDGAHPTGGSHHQKIVVIDDCFAFCGGIDMTSDRWDTRCHRDDDPGRKRPNGKPYKPWHDATSALEGPVARALGDICRDRWQRAGAAPLAPVEGGANCWPEEELDADFENIDVAVARSEPEMPGFPGVVEIEKLYLDQIARARRFIYAESQYFASRRIAEAIAHRLEEKDGPEIVLVNPLEAQGWLEPIAMDTARARLYEALRRRDPDHRFRIYHPFTSGGEPIYVHAKILIVDDQMLRIGSSNMNNRSLRLDTECDIAIDAQRDANAHCPSTIARLRNDLIAEHLAVSVETVAQELKRSGSLIDTIETLRAKGQRLRPYETPDLSDVEAWLADNEILDPEGPSEMFESLSKRGLFRRLSFRRQRRSSSRR